MVLDLVKKQANVKSHSLIS